MDHNKINRLKVEKDDPEFCIVMEEGKVSNAIKKHAFVLFYYYRKRSFLASRLKFLHLLRQRISSLQLVLPILCILAQPASTHPVIIIPRVPGPFVLLIYHLQI